MKPKSFRPDSFVPDPPPPPSVEIVPVTSGPVASQPSAELTSPFITEIQRIIGSVPQNRIDIHSPAVQEALSAIQNQSSSVGIVAWFKKHGANQRAQQYTAQTAEIGALIGLANAHNLAYAQQVASAFLPITLAQEYETKFTQHQIVQANLEYQLALVLIGQEMVKRAAKEGLTLEVYLHKMAAEVQQQQQAKLGQIRLTERKQEIDQDVEKDERLLANKRRDENLRAIDRITRVTDAKNHKLLQLRQLREELTRLITEETCAACLRAYVSRSSLLHG